MAALGQRAPQHTRLAPEPPACPVTERKLKLKGASLQELAEGKQYKRHEFQLTSNGFPVIVGFAAAGGATRRLYALDIGQNETDAP